MNAEQCDALRELANNFKDTDLLVGVKPIVLLQLLDYVEQLELVEENLCKLHDVALEQIANLQSQLDGREIELHHLKFDLLLPTQTQLSLVEQHILILRQAIGLWDRAETSDELQQAEAGLLKALQQTKDTKCNS